MVIHDLDEYDQKEPAPGFKVQFVQSENRTLAYWNLDAGAVLTEHAHPNEQVMNTLEGEFELRVGNETVVLRPRRVVVIPPNVSHSGRALTHCRIIDVFHPVRRDYK